MIAFIARSHGYKAGVILLTFVSILFLAGFASPYWAAYDVPDRAGGAGRSTDILHEGLFADCFSGGKTPSRCESFGFQAIAGWLHGVRALETLTLVILITAVSYAIVVNFCRSQPEPRYRLLEILAGVGGVLGLIGVIVYAATRKNKAHTFDTYSVELGFHLPRSNAYYYGWSLYLAGIGTSGSIIACILIAVFNEKFEDDRLADIDNKSDYSRSSRSDAGYYPRRVVAQGGYGHEREGYMRHDRDEEEDGRVSRGGRVRYDDPWDGSSRDDDLRRSKDKMLRNQDGTDYTRSKGSLNNTLDDDPVDDGRRSKGRKRQDESDARRSKGSLDRLDDDEDDRRPFRDDGSRDDEFKSWSHDGGDSDVRRRDDDDDRRCVDEKKRRDDRHAREDDRAVRRGDDSHRRPNGRESGDYKRRDDEFRRQDDRDYFRPIVDFDDDGDYRPESERDHSINSDDRRRQTEGKARRDKVYPREADDRRQEGDYRPVRPDEEKTLRQTNADKKRQSERERDAASQDAEKSQEDLEDEPSRESRRRRRRSRSRENVRQSGEFTRQNGDYARQGAKDLPQEEKVGKWLVEEVYVPPKGKLGMIYGKNTPKSDAESAV